VHFLALQQPRRQYPTTTTNFTNATAVTPQLTLSLKQATCDIDLIMNPSPIHQALPDQGSTFEHSSEDRPPTEPALFDETTPGNVADQALRKPQTLKKSRPVHLYASRSHHSQIQVRPATATAEPEPAPGMISWASSNADTLQQPLPRRPIPSLSFLDRQSRRPSSTSLSPHSPGHASSVFDSATLDRIDSIYQQSNQSHACLMRSWIKRREKDFDKDHRRSRSVMGISSF
jgi:hypothetical protein